MKNLQIVFAGCFAVVFSGCNIAMFLAGEPGSGVMSTVDREVGEFNAISLSGSGELTIDCGQAPSLTLTTDDNLIELIETDVDGDTLRIRAIKNINPSSFPEYSITTQSLNSVALSGSGTVDISNFDDESFRFDVSGSGKVRVVGKTNKVSISISGSGGADLSQLEADKVDISISGSGRANVIARQQLDISISGSGRVEYVGEAKVNQRISGSGRVIKIQSKKVASKKDDNNQEVTDSSDGEEESEEEDVEGS